MGIGGDLMWTSLAKEVYKKHNKKVCFVQGKNIQCCDVWKNNPYISFKYDENTCIKVNIGFKVLPERYSKNKWNVSQHTIISRCKHFNYEFPEKKCYMYFIKEEESYIKGIVSKLPKDFILIEPHAKTSWFKQKQYPLKKWQKIVDGISHVCPVVQMSLPGKSLLKNVIDVSSKIRNFREASLLVKYCKLFVSTEGGLMHAANAVNKKCVIIFAPLFDPIFTTYDNVVDIWVKGKHYNCFRDGTCSSCIELMNNHDENTVIKRIIDTFHKI